MKQILAAVAAIVIFGLAASANAEEVTGTITAVDRDRGAILLDDGTMYTLGEAVSVESLEPGHVVVVSYESEDGENIATAVTPAQ